MNRDQFECKFKQYRVLYNFAEGGGGEQTKARAGARSPSPQVIALGRRGFSVLVDDFPVFVAFQDHPVFRTASPEQLRQVQRPYPNRLYWPKLDVRLAIDGLRNFERQGSEPLGEWGAAQPA